MIGNDRVEGAPRPFEGDTCGQQRECAAYRIDARQQKHRADVLAATIRALQGVVTHGGETKADFVARVRAILGADPDERLTHNAKSEGADAALSRQVACTDGLEG